jgi:hypothetical protein
MSAQPDYVSFEPKARDELLFQIGSFSPSERALFQRLCDNWAPRIDADKLLKHAPASEQQERNALERLMAKLSAAGIGVLTTREGTGGRQPDQIILSEHDSVDFWAAVLDEAITRSLSADAHVLPFEKHIAEQRALPPEHRIAEADSSVLFQYHNQPAELAAVHRIRLMGDCRMLFTPRTARDLVERSFTALRHDLTDRGIIEEVARQQDAAIGEIRRRLDSRAPDVWLELARTLVKQRSAIAYRRNLTEHDRVFQLAYLIMIFVDAQIGAARERKYHDELVSDELVTLAEAVRAKGTEAVTQAEFTALVEEAQARLGTAAAVFSARLDQEMLRPKPRRKLPGILYLHGIYVHSNHVCSLFEQSRVLMAGRLTKEYTELMEAFLRGRAQDVGAIFGSRDRLNDDIARRVDREHPLLGELLARPQLLAEAVIHVAKQRRSGISSDELKSALSEYFEVETSGLRPLVDILDMNVVGIFDRAFAHISVLRQIFLRISGRHESLRATYVRRFGVSRCGGRKTRTQSRPLSPADERAADGETHPIGRYTPTEESKGAASRAPKQASAHRQKPKSRNEIEQIWQEFDKAIHTRSSKERSS